MAEINVFPIALSSFYSEIPMKVMKAMPIRPTVMKVMPRPLSAGGTLEYAIFSRMAARETMARAEGVHDGFTDVQEVLLLHEQGTAQDGAVHGDQRQEDTQGRIELRRELLDDHFHDLHDGRDDRDEDDEAEEAEVHVGEGGAEPLERAGLEHEGVQQVVDRKRDQEHGDDRDAQTRSRLDILRDRQV